MRSSEFELAWSVVRWTARFYRRHWRPIVGLSLVASAQRLVVVNWTGRLPTGLAVASEVLVAAVRLVLVVVIWRLATRGERVRWANARVFLARHRPSLIWQLVLLSLAFLVFDVALETVGTMLSDSAARTYLAVLLFVKNPTIIAFTVVWAVGVVRQVAGSGPAPGQPQRSTSDTEHCSKRADGRGFGEVTPATGRTPEEAH